jgi:hypothetical protein
MDDEQDFPLSNGPFKDAVARVNIPDRYRPGFRIVGYRVPDHSDLAQRLFALEQHDAAVSAEIAQAVAAEREACITEVIEYLEGVAERCKMIGGSETYTSRAAYVQSLIDPHIRTIRARGGADALAEMRQQARREALQRAAWVARHACLVEPDGGSPTKEEADLCDEAARRILTLIEEPSNDA